MPESAASDLWRFHSRLKVISTHSGGVADVLSDYFQRPVTVERQGLVRQALDPDTLWQLGKRVSEGSNSINEGLGDGLILGQSIMLNGVAFRVHVSVQNKEQWQRVQAWAIPGLVTGEVPMEAGFCVIKVRVNYMDAFPHWREWERA